MQALERLVIPFAFLVLASIACTSAQLDVNSSAPLQGTLPLSECALVRPWPGPNALQIELETRTSCETSAKVYVHVMEGDRRLSSIKHSVPLAAGKSNPLKSAPFQRPSSARFITVQVHACCLGEQGKGDSTPCEKGSHVWGVTTCAVP